MKKGKTVLRKTTLWQICRRTYFPARLSIRSPHTQAQYKFAVANLEQYIGRAAYLRDLTDDNVTGMVKWLIDARGLAPRTANERRTRLNALWTWLAKRRLVKRFPSNEPAQEPAKLPFAWSEDDLRILFLAAADEDLDVGDIPGSLWWGSLFSWLWNTSERISATLAVEWSHLDLDRCTALLPAEIRKGRRKWASYSLWPETVAMIRRIAEPRRQLVWPWPYHQSTYYNRYRRLLRRAGLRDDRYSKSHSLRVSHATWTKALSGQHAKTLGHSSAETTIKSYEDPRIARSEPPQLFIPWQDVG